MAERWGGRQLTHRFDRYPLGCAATCDATRAVAGYRGECAGYVPHYEGLGHGDGVGVGRDVFGGYEEGRLDGAHEVAGDGEDEVGAVGVHAGEEVAEHVRGDFRTLFGRMSSLAAGSAAAGSAMEGLK